MCCLVHLPGAESCACNDACSDELVAVHSPLANQLARAWIGLGGGGLLLFLSYGALACGSGAWLGVAGLGAGLIMRGFRVVSATRTHLLTAASQAALPPARVLH
jgi:hypothetical protein